VTRKESSSTHVVSEDKGSSLCLGQSSDSHGCLGHDDGVGVIEQIEHSREDVGSLELSGSV
jgi:hypothetical protein